MTMSLFFSSDTTVVATENQGTENKTVQYGKSPNFFVTYLINISLMSYMC